MLCHAFIILVGYLSSSGWISEATTIIAALLIEILSIPIKRMMTMKVKESNRAPKSLVFLLGTHQLYKVQQ